MHLLLWTLAPVLVRHNLPMDALEGTIWGHQLAWGYDKNPFLNAWLTALAVAISGTSGWAVYLLSQIFIVLGFWAVWQLGKKILTPVYALLAAMLLEGVQYFNFHSIDFDDNTLEIGLWGLLVLFFYRALKNHTYRDWILTGIFAGLAMMAKYYVVVLLVPLFLFLLFQKENRANFFHPGFYLALLVFSVIVLPHVIWLFQHDFITVQYALGRLSDIPAQGHHFSSPNKFFWQQVGALAGSFLLVSILWINKRPILLKPSLAVSAYDKQFLWTVALGPCLLTLLIGAVGGMDLHAGWGSPLLSFWPLLGLAYYQPVITPARFYRFITATAFFMGLLVTGYCISLITDPDSSANFPGKKIAAALTEQWHDRYHSQLVYVAGPRWLAGNVAFYSPDHPAVYIDWDPKVSFWIDEAKLRNQGAVFVWDGDDALPKDVITRFPQLEHIQKQKQILLRSNKETVEFNVGFLPPETKFP